MSDEMNSPGLRRLRAMLDDSAAGIDAATLSRLNRARQAALASRASRRRYALPLGLALAASLMLAVVVMRMQPDSAPAPVVRVDVPTPAPAPTPVPAHEEAPVPAHEDAPTLPPARQSAPARGDVQAVALDAADLPEDFASDLPGDEPEELAQEDLEFYAWLDAQEAQDG
jgi:hypothetical protein